MSWLDNLRKPKAEQPSEQPSSREFFYSHDRLANQYFAVIRLTWYLEGKVCAVTESSIAIYDKDVVSEFTSILDNALKLGADASVVCIEEAAALGIYEK